MYRLPEPARGASERDEAQRALPVEGRSWRRDLAAMRNVKSLPWLIAASALSFGPAVGVTFWAVTFLRRHHDLTAGEAAGLFGFSSLAGAVLGGWIAARGPAHFAHIKHVKVWVAAVGSIGGIGLLMLAIRNRASGSTGRIVSVSAYPKPRALARLQIIFRKSPLPQPTSRIFPLATPYLSMSVSLVSFSI